MINPVGAGKGGYMDHNPHLIVIGAAGHLDVLEQEHWWWRWWKQSNRGGGGFKILQPGNGGNGGSGIVIIRYKFQ